jgi:hypothetical protein
MARKLLLTAVLVNAERVLARLAGQAHHRRRSTGRSFTMLAKLIIGAALLAAAAPAYAEDWDFVLVNKTGKTVKAVELSGAGKAAWVSEDVREERENKPVKPGESHTVHFDKQECTLDIRLTFSDDSQTVFSNFNACDNAFGEFSYKGELPVVKGS